MCLLSYAFSLTNVSVFLLFAVPLEYDDGFDSIASSSAASSAEMYDLDAEQSQARYDPRVLSKELTGSHAPESNEDEYGSHCVNANERYEHGQKVHTTQSHATANSPLLFSIHNRRFFHSLWSGGFSTYLFVGYFLCLPDLSLNIRAIRVISSS